MNDNRLKLSRRLFAAASYIRNGSVFADIGTDHAFLPIYAVKNRVSPRAYAADINQMPLLRAEENILYYDVGGLVSCVLTSGFDNLDGLGITDAAICGMGGELIASIITAADFIRFDGFRLIIQPMTRPEAARTALGSCGFKTVSEAVVCDDHKYYTVICADYDGIVRTPDLPSSLYGDLKKAHFDSKDIKRGFVEHEIAKYNVIIRGKSSSGADVSVERLILSFLSSILREV